MWAVFQTIKWRSSCKKSLNPIHTEWLLNCWIHADISDLSKAPYTSQLHRSPKGSFSSNWVKMCGLLLNYQPILPYMSNNDKLDGFESIARHWLETTKLNIYKSLLVWRGSTYFSWIMRIKAACVLIFKK